MSEYESDVTVVSSKGQVVIPRTLRTKLKIKPKAKLLVYEYKDSIVMKELKIPNLIKVLNELHKEIDGKTAKLGGITEREINQIVQKYRHNQR